MVTKPFERLPVEPADKQVLREIVVDLLRNRGMAQARIDQLLEGWVRFADFYPAFLRVRSGPNGSIWVQHLASPQRMSQDERSHLVTALANINVAFQIDPRIPLGAPGWDVFDSEGRFLGVVTMPDRFTPIGFVGDEIYGVWKDDLDVEYVVRLFIGR